MFSFILAGIMYLPFRDALCFEFKMGWLLKIYPSSPKKLKSCGDFFLFVCVCFKGEEAQ